MCRLNYESPTLDPYQRQRPNSVRRSGTAGVPYSAVTFLVGLPRAGGLDYGFTSEYTPVAAIMAA
jgi:hypothetical protein